jgi:ankyrin repeat protein
MASTDGGGDGGGATGGAPVRAPGSASAGPRTPAQERAAALAGATWPDRCAGCGAVPDPPLRCGGCRAVNYCSAACQRADWCDHKPRCIHLLESGYAGMLESSATAPAITLVNSTGAPAKLLPPGDRLLHAVTNPATPTALPIALASIVYSLDVERLTFLVRAPQLAGTPLPLLRTQGEVERRNGPLGETILSLVFRHCAARRTPADAARALAVWRLLVARAPLEALEDPDCVAVVDSTSTVVDGMSALAYAVHAFDRQIMADAVSTLLSRGVNVNALQPPPRSSVVFKSHISENTPRSSVVLESHDSEYTILFLALQFATAQVVNILLKAGVDVRPPWQYLHLCGYFEMPEAPEKVRLLVEHGAPLEATDSEGHTPLWRASFSPICSPRTFETLLALGADLRSLMTHGAFLAIPGSNGYSLRGSVLHRAAYNSDLPVLRRLLTVPSRLACLDVNDRTEGGPPIAHLQGATPLMLAAAKASTRTARDTASTLESLRLLLAAGADLHAATATGDTALSFAIMGSRPAVVAALLEAGAADAGTPARGAAITHAIDTVGILFMRTELELGSHAPLTPLFTAEGRTLAQIVAHAAEVCRLLGLPVADPPQLAVGVTQRGTKAAPSNLKGL